MKFFKEHKKLAITLGTILLVLGIFLVVFFVYTSDYYKADMDAIEAFSSDVPWEVERDRVVIAPEGATTGIIFYPGGKVEHTAYIPLMQACAQEGIFCVIMKMPFRLAVLDIAAAKGVQEDYPQITNWYMAGHSLGGSMAASYIADHLEDYKGLILLGAYSTADLFHSGLKVLTIYGSEDQVLNREKYIKSKNNIPADHHEVVIEGGCHAYFGMYGSQDGDGTPSISNTEQIDATAVAIAQWIHEDIV